MQFNPLPGETNYCKIRLRVPLDMTDCQYKVNPISRFLRSILFVLVVGLYGCVSVGPETISRDRFDYGQAIADSWEEQMVFNMLRVRYGEAPVFLDVSQVINQYSLEGQAGVQGLLGGIPSNGTDAVGAEGAVRWADRPTITYTPLSGHRFTRSLLTPIDPSAVFAMIESGWPAEMVFPLVVRSINGVRNDFNSTSKFEHLVEAIDRLQKYSAIDISVLRGQSEAQVQINFRRELVTDQIQADVSFLQEVLGLTGGGDTFTLRYGVKAKDSDALYLQTRTILQVMEELSYGIVVPPEHVQDGRTIAAPDSTSASPDVRQLLRVQHTLEKPEEALVAVFSRGYWFTLDDRDYRSKRVLAFLMIILNLVESEERTEGPVITIGTGA